ncbi:MAG: FtsX-like permease family protein [Candidatus Aminicenantes bacterium]|nr:FtsX-like permease family protein [Candidatus Aminicenantes bacterium]
MKSGILGELFRMAADSLKAHKLRSFLTLLGIMIGVMTVIGMVSIIQGLNASFLRELQAAGSDLILIQKEDPVRMGRRTEEERTRKDFTFEDARAIEDECPLVKAVAVNLSPDFFRLPEVKYGSAKSDTAFILGINEKWPVVYNVYLPRSGRHITEAEISHRARVAVLGFELAEVLFPHTNPLGKLIRIGPESFSVIGVLEKRGEIFGQSRDNFAAIPVTTLMKYFPYSPDSLEIGAVPKTPGTISETIEQITNKLRQRRKVPFGKPNDFAIFTQETMLDLYNQITGAAYLVMIVISSIGLLVGGIGVMNIMLVSAKERTREIGIRKALGAKANDILRQFLIEAMFLTGTGGILGTLVGFGVALLVRSATPLPATVSLWSVGLGLFVSISVGLFFGIFPAQKAAKVDPIISLRYE